MVVYPFTLTLLHSERPKLYAILAFLSAMGLRYKILFDWTELQIMWGFEDVLEIIFLTSQLKHVLTLHKKLLTETGSSEGSHICFY